MASLILWCYRFDGNKNLFIVKKLYIGLCRFFEATDFMPASTDFVGPQILLQHIHYVEQKTVATKNKFYKFWCSIDFIILSFNHLDLPTLLILRESNYFMHRCPSLIFIKEAVVPYCRFQKITTVFYMFYNFDRWSQPCALPVITSAFHYCDQHFNPLIIGSQL